MPVSPAGAGCPDGSCGNARGEGVGKALEPDLSAAWEQIAWSIPPRRSSGRAEFDSNDANQGGSFSTPIFRLTRPDSTPWTPRVDLN